MHIKKLSPEATLWFKKFAEEHNFIVRKMVSVRALFEAIASGVYTIIDTLELNALRVELTTAKRAIELLSSENDELKREINRLKNGV